MGAIRLYGSTSGYLELQAPAVAPDAVLTLPSDSVQPGLVHLHTESFSSVSSVSIDNVFSSEYDNYRLVFNLTPSGTATGGNVTLRLRASGTDNSATVYSRAGSIASTTLSLVSATSQNAAFIGHAAFDTASSLWGTNTTDILAPYKNMWTAMHSLSMGVNGSNAEAFVVIGNTHRTAGVFDGFTLFFPFSCGGTIRIYGYRNS